MDWFELLAVLPREPESDLSQSRAARPALAVRFWPWGPRSMQSHGGNGLALGEDRAAGGAGLEVSDSGTRSAREKPGDFPAPVITRPISSRSHLETNKQKTKKLKKPSLLIIEINHTLLCQQWSV